jgi:hypothetical protein
MIIIVNWKKLEIIIFIIHQNMNYEEAKKNYGYFSKFNSTYKIKSLHFSAILFDNPSNLYSVIKRPTTWNYEPHLFRNKKWVTIFKCVPNE